ncbi:MAG: arginyltransferase [Stellaceae bacterium]
MDVGPVGGNRPNGDRLWRDPRRAAAQDVLAAPLHQFFATAAVPCPYVPGRAERKLIIELGGGEGAGFYDELSRAGFRRSHRFAYRPACRICTACVPVRIAVAGFHHTRSTRRVRNANRDLAGDLVGADLGGARATPEQFRLFLGYQRARHGDSEMATMTYADYRGMVEDSPVETRIAEFRDAAGTLLAASLIDLLDDGVSAVYSFYDPQQTKRSLGTWSILWLVEHCRRYRQAYVYLGYWIADSPKMAYKARFPALERLTAAGWTDFAPPAVSATSSLAPPAGRGPG